MLEHQINTAKEELSTFMPWVDLSHAKWNTFFINRAEPIHANKLRQISYFAKHIHNVSIAWPVKLALTPVLADNIINHITQVAGIEANKFQSVVPDIFERPKLATPFWRQTFAL